MSDESTACDLTEPRRRSTFSRHMTKFLSQFPDLRYDGTAVYCRVCGDRKLAKWDTISCRHHVGSARHKMHNNAQLRYGEFLSDFILMLNECEIPRDILDETVFKLFWRNYAPKWPLPNRRHISQRFRDVMKILESNIKSRLHSKPLWLTVYQTRDAKNNKFGNVAVRVLHTNRSSKPFLIASKRLKNNTPETYEVLVLEALDKFGVENSNVLMLVTDGSELMLSLSARLKSKCSNLLHLTCFLQALQIAEEVIKSSYTDVTDLIDSTRMALCKMKKQKSRKVKLPPEQILTGRCTWLHSALYFSDNFDQLKSLIADLDAKGALDSQRRFDCAQTQLDLLVIRKNFGIVSSSLEKLQHTSFSLREAFDVIDNLSSALYVLTDDCPAVGGVVERFDIALRNCTDYIELRSINELLRKKSGSGFHRNYAYASVTSLDVQRSFSKYNTAFVSEKTSLSANMMEDLLIMQVYAGMINED